MKFVIVFESGDAADFDSASAARRIIKTAVWCQKALENGWRASVRAVKEERGQFFRRFRVTAEIWPEASAIDALAAVLHDGGKSNGS